MFGLGFTIRLELGSGTVWQVSAMVILFYFGGEWQVFGGGAFSLHLWAIVACSVCRDSGQSRAPGH